MHRYAELKGITLYPIDEGADFDDNDDHFWIVPPEQRGGILKDEAWERATTEERKKSNNIYEACTLTWYEFDRTDPIVIQVIEELGDQSWSFAAKLEIRDIPAGTLYRIVERDGFENIELCEDVNWKVAT